MNDTTDRPTFMYENTLCKKLRYDFYILYINALWVKIGLVTIAPFRDITGGAKSYSKTQDSYRVLQTLKEVSDTYSVVSLTIRASKLIKVIQVLPKFRLSKCNPCSN